MSSFDQSLKHLLHSHPEDFIRFGMGDPSIELLEPAEAALPARPAGNRDVDGGYRFRCGDERLVGHVEFHRRHQSRKSLALDVGEAQIRFHRREGLRVVSFVWDLYGKADHLAVLRFVGEKEHVALAVLEAYVSEEELMASTLYKSIFQKGEAQGEAKGEARTEAVAIVEILRNWLGKVDPAVRERLTGLSDLETLTPWFTEALAVRDAAGARRLAKKIRSARPAEARAA